MRRCGFTRDCHPFVHGALALGLFACAAPVGTPKDEVYAPGADAELLVEADHEAAEVAFVQGTYLRERGEAVGALVYLDEAVRLWPENTGLRLALARQNLEMGRIAAAESLLERTVAAGAASAPEHLLLARLRVVAGKREGALAQVAAALAADSTLVAAWLLQGRLQSDLGQHEAALESYKRADALQPYRAATLVQLGGTYERLGRDGDAESSYRRALGLEPLLGAARTALVELYERGGRTADAIALQQEALKLEPENQESLEWLVQLYLREKRYADVVSLLQPRLAAGALEARHEYVLGWAFLQIERFAAAESVLVNLSAHSEVPGVEHLLGEVALRQDHDVEAEAHFRKSIAMEPDACAAHLGLATVLLERLRDADGRIQRQGAAADTLRRVLATAAAHTPATEYRCNVLLGFAYVQLREFELAVRHLEAGRALSPDNIDLLFNLAMTHQELGHTDSALAYGRDVLRREPDHAPALNFVGYVQAERGVALEESEALVRKALAAEPDNGYYVDSLGWVLYQRGRISSAVETLERAAALTKQRDAIILEHLGDAYVKAGRPGDARRVYERSRELAPENHALRAKIAALEELGEKP